MDVIETPSYLVRTLDRRSTFATTKIGTMVGQSVAEFHPIKIAATELADLHLNRCATTDGMVVPFVDQTFFRSCFMAVTHFPANRVAGRGGRPKQDPGVSDSLLETRNSVMEFGDGDRFDRSGFDQVIGAASASLAASFNTNLFLHCFKRSKATLSKLLPCEQGSTKAERKRHALRICRLAADIFRVEPASLVGDAEMLVRLAEWKGKLSLTNLPFDVPMSIVGFDTEKLKRLQPLVYRSVVKLNLIRRAYVSPEGYRMKEYAACPSTTSLVPQHVQLDHRSITSILAKRHGHAVGRSDADRLQERMSTVKKLCRRRSKAEKERKGIAPHPIWVDAKSKADALRRLPALQHLLPDIAMSVSHPLLTGWVATIIQRRIRVCLATTFSAAVAAKVAAAKAGDFEAILNMKMLRKKAPKGYSSFHSLRYDGVSVSVLYKKDGARPPKAARGKEEPPGKKRRVVTPLPKPGRLHFAKDISRNDIEADFQLVGLDPGKEEIFRIVDPTTILASKREAWENRKTSMPYPTQVYRGRRRRHEIHERDHCLLREFELSPEIKAAQSALSAFARHSSDPATKRAYYNGRRTSLLPLALPHYGQIKYRHRSFRKRSWKQRADALVVNRILEMKNTSKPLAIAYGAGSRGHPGMPGNKGRPPCPGVGMARKIAKHVVVIITPEHYTSKTCCLCQGECGRVPECDAKLRLSRIRREGHKQHDPVRKERFMRSLRGCESRSIRRCHNETCRAHLHRDYNAAVNIREKCKNIISGTDPPVSSEEAELQHYYSLED